MEALSDHLQIGDRRIGPGQPTYIVAELSGNHNGDLRQALELVKAAKRAGADAVKLQTYTADTLTIDSEQEVFRIPSGNTWEGRTLHDLYREASTPWEWQPELKAAADGLGIELFSTAFDLTSVEFLEQVGVRAYKIASFELVDLELIRAVAKTGKPVIASTGLATLGEIEEAVQTARQSGCRELALLECASAYPASPTDYSLLTIPHLSQMFGVPTGLSDHTLGIAVAIAGVAVGARIVEKHLKLSDESDGPDAAFSITPSQLAQLVEGIRTAEEALGEVSYQVTDRERANRCFRRSLFAVRDIRVGEKFTRSNTRSIRPGFGLAPMYLGTVLDCRASRSIRRGEPISWDMLYGGCERSGGPEDE